MTTATRPILRSEQPQLYIFRLIAFKKNDHDLELAISARSIIAAWDEARRRSFGFPYYLQAIHKPNKKAAPKPDCLKAQT